MRTNNASAMLSAHIGGHRLPIYTTVLEGEIRSVGGQDAHIQIQTTKGALFIVGCDEDKFAAMSENNVRKRRYIRVSYMYDPASGKDSDYKFVEFVEPKHVSDERIAQLIAQETPAWENISDVGAWVRELRGGEEAECRCTPTLAHEDSKSGIDKA